MWVIIVILLVGGGVLVGLVVSMVRADNEVVVLLNWYSVLAAFCGITLFIYALVNAIEFTPEEMGAWMGYTIGSVLSMMTVITAINLLMQIRDAMENITALSPSRPDDE